jgi:hypothetical protein
MSSGGSVGGTTTVGRPQLSRRVPARKFLPSRGTVKSPRARGESDYAPLNSPDPPRSVAVNEPAPVTMVAVCLVTLAALVVAAVVTVYRNEPPRD